MAVNVKDASPNTEIVEKSPLTLDKLPVDVLEEVTGWLPLVDCLVLRKVSRDLQSFVDSNERHCKDLSFGCLDDWVTMKLDDLELGYGNREDGSSNVVSHRLDTQKTRTQRDDRNFKQVFLTDASTFLKMPKLEIGHLKFIGKATGLELMQCFKSRNLPLNVRSIWSDDLELLHLIQEFLNPEKLKEIICSDFGNVDEFNELAATNMDFVKNPKLKFGTISFRNYSDESSAKFSEILKSINSQLNMQTINVKDGRWIPTLLQSVNPEKTEIMIIKDYVNLTADHFNAIAGKMQWKTKTGFYCRTLPEGIRLGQLVDFKEIRSSFEFTEENGIIIRDILLKSPHLDLFTLANNPIVDEYDEDELNERIDRIMSEDPAYDASTRRFSIPNSQDYFHLELKEEWTCLVLTIRRISPQ